MVAAPAPGAGPGYWAGAPCAVLEADGTFVLAYRVRNGHDGNDEMVVARSDDGERLEPVATLDESRFGAHAVERRAALVRLDDGRFAHVCVLRDAGQQALVDRQLEAGTTSRGSPRPSTRSRSPATSTPASRTRSYAGRAGAGMPGSAATRSTSRARNSSMSTAYATSDDGLAWDWHGTVLAGRPGRWDARGARLTTILARRTRRLRRPSDGGAELV